MADFEAEDIDRLRAALGRVSRQLDRQVSDGELTRTQLEVLATVARRGPVGVSELAEVVNVNPTMLSRILSKLETAGLAVRSASDDDRRAVRVAATAAGTRLSNRLRSARTKVLRERVELMPQDEAQRLLAALPALELLAEAMMVDPVRL